MMMSWKILSILVLTTIFISCGSDNKEANQEDPKVNNTLEPMIWLEGTWMDGGTFGFQQPPLLLHEKWTVFPDSLSGIAFNVQGTDTIIKESITIMVVNDKLTYVARPDNKAMITFTLTSSSNNSWVFENKANDFPQKLIYQKLPNDSLSITLEGIQNTMKRTIDLRYEKK